MFLGTNREDYLGCTGCSWRQIEKTALDVLDVLGRTNREDCLGYTVCSWGQIQKTALGVFHNLGVKKEMTP